MLFSVRFLVYSGAFLGISGIIFLTTGKEAMGAATMVSGFIWEGCAAIKEAIEKSDSSFNYLRQEAGYCYPASFYFTKAGSNILPSLKLRADKVLLCSCKLRTDAVEWKKRRELRSLLHLRFRYTKARYMDNINKTNKKPGVGVGIMILRESKILLGKRHEDPEKADSLLHGEGTWTLPGGKLDFKEDIPDCAYREVYEETGIKINKNKIKIVSITNDVVEDAHFVTIVFLAEEFEGEPKVMEPDEIIEWKWFNLNELPQPMFFPSEKAVKNYLNKENKF